jgi:membrane associated rhomboid family serine protease
LLTSAFLHYDLLHIAGNSLALFFVGRVLEIHYGSHRLWVLYVIFAVTSGLGSASWNALVATGKLPFGHVGVSAGASGAVFGLLLLGYVYARAHPHRLGSVANGLRVWIFAGVVITFALPNVDVAGHLTGALAGAVAGSLVQPVPGEDPHPAWKPAAVALAVLALLCVGAAVWTLRQSS